MGARGSNANNINLEMLPCKKWNDAATVSVGGRKEELVGEGFHEHRNGKQIILISYIAL